MMKIRKPKMVTLALAIIGFSLAVFEACQQSDEKKHDASISTPKSQVEAIEKPAFVGEETCAQCHDKQIKDWNGSHHQLAMQEANDSTMLGAFDGRTFESRGVKSKFYKKGEEFWVNTQGNDGQYHDYKLDYAFGVEPLQQYLAKFPDGKYQVLRTAWDTEKNKWFDIYPTLDIDPTEWLHWTGGAMRWNTMCADCHSTNLKKGFDEASNTYNTTFSAINVSCEACHGPGSQHVAFYESNGKRGNAKLKQTGDVASELQVDECGRCHARRSYVSNGYDPHQSFDNQFVPSMLTEDIYEVDGQIKDEDYVYGSFLQSKMYANHVKCTDCHNPHSLELKFKGNNLCYQCHEEKKFGAKDHHFHGLDTEGAECINCHMPGKFYMVNDFRRDHSFRIPRPDLSVKYGTPNACNGCHTDKSSQWAKKAVEKWHGKERPDHFSEKLAKGIKENTPEGRQALVELAQDGKYPAIARATALQYVGGYSQAEVNAIRNLLSDSSSLVRQSAALALGNISMDAFLPEMQKALNDSNRTVRIAAYSYLSRSPAAQSIPQSKEYEDYLAAQADFPGGQLSKGVYLQHRGDLGGAEAAYKRALAIDDWYNMARINLALLYYQQKKYEPAVELYKKVIEIEPEYGQTYYSLGLLLVELNKKDEAIGYLEKAAELSPENARIPYNLALLLIQEQKFDKAEKLLKKSLIAAPQDESLLYAMSYLLVTQNRRDEAQPYLKKLLSIAPNNPNYRQLASQQTP